MMNLLVESVQRNSVSEKTVHDGAPVIGAAGALVLVIACTLLACGCLGMYGSLKADSGVTRMFTTGTALPDYRYYYTGRTEYPEAVIGIAPEYSLESSFWHPIKTRGEVMAKVSRVGVRLRDNPRGFLVMDASGNPAGFWYSHVHRTVVKVGENNEINVYPPNRGGLAGNRRNYDHRLLIWNLR